MRTRDEIPVLGIGEFRIDQQSDKGFQYHKICGSRMIEKPHKHDFFLFLLFDQGSGTHTIDFVEHRVAAHQLHLLFPDQIHSWKLGDDTSAQQIMVSKQIFQTFAHSLRYDFVLYQNHPVMDLDAETFQKLSYEFRAIEFELLTEQILWDIVGARCTIIAQMVSREAEKVFDDPRFFPSKPALLEYRSMINVHFKEQKSVSFYADKLNLTPNYLNILCRKYFHTSATALIHSRLILEAKRLLLTSKNPVKEVAYDLGFYDLAYFSKFFKTQTGMSPRQFREL